MATADNAGTEIHRRGYAVVLLRGFPDWPSVNLGAARR